MNIHEKLKELNKKQVNSLLQLISGKFKTKTNIELEKVESLIKATSEVDKEVLSKLILHASIANNSIIKAYVIEQLKNNKDYFEGLKVDDNYRSTSEVIPYLLTLIVGLGIDIKLEVKDGKLVKLELATGLLSIPIIATLFKQLKTKVEGKNIFINSTLSAQNIHVGDQNEVNNYYDIESSTEVNSFNFWENNNTPLHKEIEMLRGQLEVFKNEIIEGIKVENLQLEKSILLAFNKMSKQEVELVKKAITESEYLPLSQAKELLEVSLGAIDYLDGNLREAINELKTMLSSKEKIATKLRIIIPFLPFVSILHEYDGNNPLNKWWHKIKNILL